MDEEQTETTGKGRGRGRKAGNGGELVAIAGHRRRWPLPPIADTLSDEYREMASKTADACEASRGVIASDLEIATHAAVAASEAARWRQVETIALAGGEDGGPDIDLALRAAAACERFMQRHLALVNALGLRGRDFGSKRAQQIRARVGVPGSGKWADLED